MGMLRWPPRQRLRKRSQHPGGLARDREFRKSQTKIWGVLVPKFLA